jgi:hypothetical protein
MGAGAGNTSRKHDEEFLHLRPALRSRSGLELLTTEFDDGKLSTVTTMLEVELSKCEGESSGTSCEASLGTTYLSIKARVGIENGRGSHLLSHGRVRMVSPLPGTRPRQGAQVRLVAMATIMVTSLVTMPSVVKGQHSHCEHAGDYCSYDSCCSGSWCHTSGLDDWYARPSSIAFMRSSHDLPIIGWCPLLLHVTR